MYLLDTMVLSGLRQLQRAPQLVVWLRSIPESSLFISVMTIGEIEKGIAAVRSRDPVFTRRLEAWRDSIPSRFASRILPVDVDIARRWGQLAAALGHGGVDLLLAATALEHRLTVVTRNLRHFEGTNVPLVDPFVPAPGTAEPTK